MIQESGWVGGASFLSDLMREGASFGKAMRECDRPTQPSLTACVIGLAGKGRAHETKTEMAGDCSRRLGAGIRHGIIVVATRPDHRRIVQEDSHWNEGGGGRRNSWRGCDGLGGRTSPLYQRSSKIRKRTS